MFFNFIKDFFTNKIIKNKITDVKDVVSDNPIKTVGILFDGSNFHEREAIIQDLIEKGIQKANIQVLVFKDKIKKNETFDFDTFSSKDLSWAATFNKSEVNHFISQKFDLLINYYDVEKPALLLVSNQSKSNFKVGFATINKKLNHFMINTNAENHKVFIDELFKYLKILNKI